MHTTAAWNELCERTRQLRALSGVIGLVQWDQHVMMPRAAAPGRGVQLSLLTTLYHEQATDPRLGELLLELESGPLDAVQGASVRELRRSYDQSVKVPKALEGAIGAAKARANGAWLQARQDADFTPFAGPLEELVKLNRERADAIRSPDCADPYDVLLEGFDPGVTVAWLDPMFSRLSDEVNRFLDGVRGKEGPPPLTAHFDLAGQESLHRELVQTLGFDLVERGRLDFSEHPFTVGQQPSDVRLTTHLYPNALLSGLGGTVHETGHGLYEQGLPQEWADLPVGAAASCGLHESQSRFWENFIGRSLPFFRYLRRRMPDHLSGPLPTPEQLFGAANRVQPSLIRIFADEVTYNLHIVVRYQLERQLFSGALPVKQLPEAWDAAYQRVLGIKADSPVDGVLQDVHWSLGSFGYFPSYTLGNLFSASLGAAVQQDIPQLWEQVERGEFSHILAWLRDKVHRHGHLLDAQQIISDAVGERDHVADLVAHFERRQGSLYGD